MADVVASAVPGRVGIIEARPTAGKHLRLEKLMSKKRRGMRRFLIVGLAIRKRAIRNGEIRSCDS